MVPDATVRANLQRRSKLDLQTYPFLLQHTLQMLPVVHTVQAENASGLWFPTATIPTHLIGHSFVHHLAGMKYLMSGSNP